MIRDTHAISLRPPAGVPAAVRPNGRRGGARPPRGGRVRRVGAVAAVKSRGMSFHAPASARRPREQRGMLPKAGRTRGASRSGSERPSIQPDIVGIATAFVARMLDLNDGIATCALPEAGAPARHPQSIGPVR